MPVLALFCPAIPLLWGTEGLAPDACLAKLPAAPLIRGDQVSINNSNVLDSSAQH